MSWNNNQSSIHNKQIQQLSVFIKIDVYLSISVINRSKTTG